MEFIHEKYSIVQNLSTIDCPHDELIETYEKDLEVISEQVAKNHKKVWTVLDHGEEKYKT